MDQDIDRASEVESLLEADDTGLGEVWRRDRDGLSVQAIADESGTTTGPVYAQLRLIRALRDGELSTSPSVANGHAMRIRSWLKHKALSDGLRKELEAQAEILQGVAENVSSREEEDFAAVLETKQAEDEGRPGIYVYTLPHYLRYPYEPDTRKTLLKVGHSARDAYYRAGTQARLTALPEDPVLLRIYPAVESAQIERQFHDWLRDADHARSAARRGGSEWFVTSTRFLDRVARSLNLEVVTYNDHLDLADA